MENHVLDNDFSWKTLYKQCLKIRRNWNKLSLLKFKKIGLSDNIDQEKLYDDFQTEIRQEVSDLGEELYDNLKSKRIKINLR